MLSQAPAARPSAAAFASCQWFQEDVALRALRFLDTMLQREAGQKVRACAAMLRCCVFSCCQMHAVCIASGALRFGNTLCTNPDPQIAFIQEPATLFPV